MPKAIVLGRRQIHPGWLKLGAITFALGAPFVSVSTWLQATGRNIDHYKPFWVLSAESRCGHTEIEMSALAELQRRIVTKKLTTSQLADLANESLVRGRNLPRRLESAWRGIYVSCAAVGTVRQELLTRFFAESMRPIVAFRTPVRPGDPLPFSLHYVFSSAPIDARTSIRPSSITIRINGRETKLRFTQNLLGRPITDSAIADAQNPVTMSNLDRAYCFDDRMLLNNLPPGEHSVSGELAFDVLSGDTLLQLKLPWSAKLEIADQSAEGLRSVAPWDAWPTDQTVLITPTVRLPRFKEDPAISSPRRRVIHLPRPKVDGVLPVRVKLRSVTGEIDCGLAVLAGSKPNQNWLPSCEETAEVARVLDGDELRVIISPADNIAWRWIGATATLSAGRTWRATKTSPRLGK